MLAFEKEMEDCGRDGENTSLQNMKGGYAHTTTTIPRGSSSHISDHGGNRSPTRIAVTNPSPTQQMIPAESEDGLWGVPISHQGIGDLGNEPVNDGDVGWGEPVDARQDHHSPRNPNQPKHHITGPLHTTGVNGSFGSVRKRRHQSYKTHSFFGEFNDFGKASPTNSTEMSQVSRTRRGSEGMNVKYLNVKNEKWSVSTIDPNRAHNLTAYCGAVNRMVHDVVCSPTIDELNPCEDLMGMCRKQCVYPLLLNKYVFLY